jgi:rhodanese-related sulfurtransferase
MKSGLRETCSNGWNVATDSSSLMCAIAMSSRGFDSKAAALYFEMRELGGKDEMLDAVVAYVERDLADQLPTDLPILAVCAKGDTSEFVAQGLRRLGYASANLKGGMRATWWQARGRQL